MPITTLPDKWQALQTFWSSFGLNAYDENTVPENAEMPYITYEAKTANLDKPLFLSAQLFYYSTSWKEISEKADEIAQRINYGHCILPVQGGYLYITQGSPFSQRMTESNNSVRRIVINIACEFLTGT